MVDYFVVNCSFIFKVQEFVIFVGAVINYVTHTVICNKALVDVF